MPALFSEGMHSLSKAIHHTKILKKYIVCGGKVPLFIRHAEIQDPWKMVLQHMILQPWMPARTSQVHNAVGGSHKKI